MKTIAFTLSGTCLVPDGSTPVEGFANHVRLPGGQLISIQPVIEMASGADADDHRDISYDEAVALDIYLECEDRNIELHEERG
ncbi:hypothetical protein [Sphingomonas oryzagri]